MGPISKKCGHRWIRTTEGENQQIYSLPHLATLVLTLVCRIFARQKRADGRIRTVDPEITNHVLWPTELHRQYFNSLELGNANLDNILKLSKLFEFF